MKTLRQLATIASLLFLQLCLLPSSRAPAAAETDSLLSAYIAESLQNHPNLASMQTMIAANQSRERMARSWMNPDLTLGVMNLPTSLDFHEEAMTSVDFGFMLRIPFPGKLKSAGEAQKAKTLTAQSDYEQAKLNMTAMVKMAYYELAGLNAVKSSLEEGARLADNLIKAAQAMTASGLGNQADILRAQLEKDRWQQRCIRNEQDIANARSRLAAALGRPTTDNWAEPNKLNEPAPQQSLEQWLAKSDRAPSLEAEAAKVQSAEKTLQNSKLQYYPDVDLSFSYGWRDYLKAGAMGGDPEMRTPLNDMISLEARIPIPLFSRGNQRALIQESEAMRRSAQSDYESAKLKLRDEVRQAYARFEAAKNNHDLIRNSLLPHAEAAFHSSLAAYQTGGVPYMTLNEALLQVVMQKMDREMSLADVHMALAELERLTGKTLNIEGK
jgi:outer membrane protein TolC